MINLSSPTIAVADPEGNPWRQQRNHRKIIGGVKEKIKGLDDEASEKSAQRISDMRLATTLQDLEQTKQELHEIKNQLKQYTNIEKSHQPTASALAIALEKTTQVIKKLTTFEWDLNVLSQAVATTTQDCIKPENKLEDLQKNLQAHDVEFDKLSNTCKNLMPDVSKDLSELNEIAKKATHEHFTDKQMQAFSAKQGTPLEIIEANNQNFDIQLNSYNIALNQLNDMSARIKPLFDKLKIDLDNIDHNLFIKETNCWNLNPLGNYWGKKIRISPFDQAAPAAKTAETV